MTTTFDELIAQAVAELEKAMDRHTALNEYEPAVDVLLESARIKAMLALAIATSHK